MAVSPAEPTERAGLLQEQLVGLAGTPDDSSLVSDYLVLIAQLAAERMAAVDYASVTSRYEGAYATVAVSSDPAITLDEAQYRDDAGPCLEALDATYPAAVPEIATTITWPGFREAAGRLGLRSSLSVPLFAGSGRTIAALNLYAREPGAMKVLTAAIWAVFDPEADDTATHDELDPGGREFAAGLISAMALRNLIQQAIGVLMETTGRDADCAYLALRMRAAEAGASLTDTAVQVIEEQQF